MMKEKATELLNQLRRMWTNHPERTHYPLDISVFKHNGKKVIERQKFEIYANDPITKIEEKIEKLKTKGGLTTLTIRKLNKTEDGGYNLELEI